MYNRNGSLQAALKGILADTDEAFIRFATDTRTDERGLDCLSRSRKDLSDVIDKLEEETSTRPIV